MINLASLQSLQSLGGSRKKSSVLLQWYEAAIYKADGSLPTLIMDFKNDRYAVNSVPKKLWEISTYARNTSATFIGADGKLHRSAYNQWNYSCELTNPTWTPTRLTPTYSTTELGPTGHPVSTLTEDTQTNPHYISKSAGWAPSENRIASFYIKPNGRSKVRMEFRHAAAFGGLIPVIQFDLIALTVNVVAGTFTNYAIEPSTGGYVRIWANPVCSASGSGFVDLYMLDNAYNAAYTGNGASGIKVSASQLEYWTFQTGVNTPSDFSYTGATATGGIRLMYRNGVRDGYLIERQATNLLPYAASMRTSNGYFGTPSGSLVNGVGIANDNTTQWSRLTEQAVMSQQYAGYAPVSVTLNQQYTFSIYAMPETATVLQITASAAGFGTNNYVNYNLANGTVSASGPGVIASYIELQPDGSYRCFGVFQATATSAGITAIFALTDNNPSGARVTTYTGTGKSLKLWGAMIDNKNIPSSFVYTGAASVTKSGDNLSLDTILPSVLDYTKATFYSAFRKDYLWETFNRVMSSNILHPQIFANGANMSIEQNATNITPIAIAPTNNYAKIAGAMNNSTLCAAQNGVLATQVAAGTMSAITSLSIGWSAAAGFRELSGSMQEFRIYNIRASNLALQSITTP